MAQNEKIIISVVLQDKNVSKKTKEAATSIKKLSVEQKALAKATKEANFWTTEQGKALAKAKISATIAKKETFELAQAQLELTKKTKQGRTQTGLNNAILTEAGRTASDAAYGMQGMANNLGQLLTLMSQHVETKGGFVASMKSLGKSLMGSGGVLILLQLLISYLPQIQAWFEKTAGSVFKVSDAMRGAGEAMSGTRGDFEIYISTLQSSTKSAQEKKDVINALNKEFPDFVQSLEDSDLSLQDVAKSTEAATKKTDLYIQAIKRQAMADAARNKIQEASGKQLEAQIQAELRATELGFKSVEEMQKAGDKIKADMLAARETRAKEGTGFWGEDFSDWFNEELMTDVEAFFGVKDAQIAKEVTALEDATKLFEVTRDKLLKFVDIEPKDPKGDGGSDAERIFTEKTLSYIQEIQQARKIAVTDDMLDEEEALAMKQELRRQELQDELDAFNEREQKRFDVFMAREGLTKKEKDNATANFENGKKLAQASYDNAIKYIKLAEEAENNVLKHSQGVAQTALNNKKIAFDQDIALLKEKIERTRELVDSSGDDIKGLIVPDDRKQAEGELEGLEGDVAKKKASLDALLALDQVSTEEKMRLEKEYTEAQLAAANKRVDIAKMEQQSKEMLYKDAASLLDSGSKLAKKGTATQKALAISSTAVSTWRAAQSAYEGQMALATPESPIRAQIAWAAAVAKGIIGVKNIMSEKKAKGGGGGASASPQQIVQPPDFNIIGSTGVNQLAGAIGTTTKEPVKAYVVSSEVSTAQELDRNIVESASI